MGGDTKLPMACFCLKPKPKPGKGKILAFASKRALRAQNSWLIAFQSMMCVCAQNVYARACVMVFELNIDCQSEANAG